MIALRCYDYNPVRWQQAGVFLGFINIRGLAQTENGNAKIICTIICKYMQFLSQCFTQINKIRSLLWLKIAT